MNIPLSMHYQTSPTHNESGNVLIYILIGIVLLAALNFAFSQGADTGSDSTVDRGEAVIAASDIIRYAGTVAETVRDLQRRQGCSENDISFNFESNNYEHTSPSAPAKCKVFKFDGGGLNYESPKDKWVTASQEWYFPNDVCVQDVGTSSSCSSGNEEMVMMLPNIDQNICEQINSKLNIGSVPSIAWTGDFSSSYYTGNLSATRQIGGGMAGKRSGCFADNDSTPGGRHYYHVIMAR